MGHTVGWQMSQSRIPWLWNPGNAAECAFPHLLIGNYKAWFTGVLWESVTLYHRVPSTGLLHGRHSLSITFILPILKWRWPSHGIRTKGQLEHTQKEQDFQGCLSCSESVFSQIPLPELLQRLDFVHLHWFWLGHSHFCFGLCILSFPLLSKLTFDT